MNAALATAELLAGILEELDMKTLLFARRVSRQWFAVIRSSPELQEKLFYTHRPKKGEDTRYLWNPSIRHLEPWGQNLLQEDSNSLRYRGTRTLAPIRINPLLTEEILPLEIDGSTDQGQRIECVATTELLKSPDGSWQSMFLTQPPVTRVFAQALVLMRVDPLRVDARGRPLPHVLDVEDSSGVRMSQVVEKVLSIAYGLGLGVESLRELRLDNWSLTFPHCVELSDEPFRVALNTRDGNNITTESPLIT